MTQAINAEVISIGTEILLGELTDTNSVFIARVLRDLGINIYYMTSVGDNEQRIADAIRIAFSRAQLVITCGGLGPTIDDMTRQAVATATERGLTFHQNLLDQIAARFAGFQVRMSDNNRRQAYLPDDAIVIENPVGTAPSFIVEYGDKRVISLPGVPRELKFLMTESVVPYLRGQYQLGIIKARTLKVAGIGESTLDEMIGSDLLEQSNPSIGLAAHSGQIDIRITAKADDETQADTLIDIMERAVRERVGHAIFGTDNAILEDELVKLMAQEGYTLSVAEAGLKDGIAASLKATQGSESVIVSIVEHSRPDDVRELLTLPDATLRDLTAHWAESIHSQSGASVTIAVISNPDTAEGADAIEDTAVTVFTSWKTRSRVYGFGSQSELARTWVKTWALSAVWQMLQEKRHA